MAAIKSQSKMYAIISACGKASVGYYQVKPKE
jgi:hypothetical protein